MNDKPDATSEGSIPAKARYWIGGVVLFIFLAVVLATVLSLRPDIPASATLPSKELLERQKLSRDLLELDRPWFQSPQNLFGAASVILAFIAAIVTVVFQARISQINSAKAELNLQRV